MTTRRNLLIGAVAAAVSVPVMASADTIKLSLEDLRIAFQKNPQDVRKYLQEGLRDASLYSGAIDGAWGPGTAAGYQKVMASPEYKNTAASWNMEKRYVVDETLWFMIQDDGTDY